MKLLCNHGRGVTSSLKGLNCSTVAKTELLVMLVGVSLRVGHEDSCFLVQLVLTRIGLHGLYGLVVRVLHLNCKLGYES